MNNQTKQYRPLTGPEIIDYIVTEIRAALERSGQLPLHRAFHEMSFVGGIKVSGWGTADAKVQFSGATNGGHPDDAEAVKIAVGIRAEAEPPSLVRERLVAPLVTTLTVPDDLVMRVSDNGEVAAGYRDEQGFHAVDPSTIKAEVKLVESHSVQVGDVPPATQDANGNFPCTNFGNGCDHVPFASKAAMISHRNNWCAVSGRRRR